jgi:hypothetical protein
MTEGQRRARKALRRACAISGVTLSVAGEAPERETVQDVLAIVLRNRCALMGWPETDLSRALARDGRMGTLYGRIALSGRWGGIQGALALDVVKALDTWGKLTRQYERIVLGRAHPGDADGPAIVEAENPRALTDKWMAARGVADSADPITRSAVRWAMKAGPDVAPSTVSSPDAARIALGGLALYGHFCGAR